MLDGTQADNCREKLARVMFAPNTWLQPTAEDLLASLAAPSVPSLRSAAAEPQRSAKGIVI